MPILASLASGGGFGKRGQGVKLFVTGTQAFSTAGNTSWTVPSGVFAIRAYMWGAGGTAGRGNSNGTNGGDGGGSGSLNACVIPVTPGETLTMRVGNSASFPRSNGSPSASGAPSVGGGGRGGNGDGTGSNGGGGGAGGGASSILRGGTFIAIAAGGGAGNGVGYPQVRRAGSAGGSGNASGGSRSSAPSLPGSSGSAGGGGGGGGGSGSSRNNGSGGAGVGGSNVIPTQPSNILGTAVVAGTSLSGSGTTAANTGSPRYVSGVGIGGNAAVSQMKGGDGYIFIEY